LRDSGVKHGLINLLSHSCLARIKHASASVEAQILNRVLDVAVSRHMHYMVERKFAIGAAVDFIAFEAVLKELIYEVDEARREFEKIDEWRRTLGAALRVFEEHAVPSLPRELQSDVQRLNRVVEGIWERMAITGVG